MRSTWGRPIGVALEGRGPLNDHDWKPRRRSIMTWADVGAEGEARVGRGKHRAHGWPNALRRCLGASSHCHRDSAHRPRNQSGTRGHVESVAAWNDEGATKPAEHSSHGSWGSLGRVPPEVLSGTSRRTAGSESTLHRETACFRERFPRPGGSRFRLCVPMCESLFSYRTLPLVAISV